MAMERSVTTALEYREYAKECMESAQTAASNALREHFLELEKLWTAAADEMEALLSPFSD